MLAYHCAPCLKQVKMANMFHVSRISFPHAKEMVLEYNDKLKNKGLEFRILQAEKPRITFYLFSTKEIEKVLNQPVIQSFLQNLGYPTDSVSACLDHLETRMEEASYPHEIGIFLGYPYEDVLGFIHHKPCCGVGAWKVYDAMNLERSQALFALFDRIRNQFIYAVENGAMIEQLI